MADTPDAVVSIDGSGRVVDWDDAAERIFDRRREDVLGRDLADLIIPSELREWYRRGLARFLEPGDGPMLGRRIQLVALRADGSPFPVELMISAIRMPDGEHKFTALVRGLEHRSHGALPLVAHELRTPLTAIQGCLGALADSTLAARDRRIVELATKAAARMDRLIADLLALRRAELGSATSRHEAVGVANLLRDGADAARAQAAASGVGLHFDALPAELFVSGDREGLLQVLANLLSNAIRFSPCGATVRLSCEQRDTMVRVDVSDRGPGISETFRDHLFQWFAHGAGGPLSHTGSGLGLAICRLIVEGHGGRIGFEPAPEGGATFYFELPAADAVQGQLRNNNRDQGER